MTPFLRELRDPAGLALAAVTGIGNLALGAPLLVAAAAAVAVLAVKVGASLAWPGSVADAKRRDSEPVTTIRSGVTRRELEIAELITSGLSNREIARKLFLSERTVDNHVQHLLNKLDFHSRTQIAAWVASSRLTPPS